MERRPERRRSASPYVEGLEAGPPVLCRARQVGDKSSRGHVGVRMSSRVDGYGSKGFVFEDVSGRRWPRAKRMALAGVGLGALLLGALVFALLTVAPGRTSPWSAAAGLPLQVSDQPSPNPGLGARPGPASTPAPKPGATARPAAAVTERSRGRSRASATSLEKGRSTGPDRPAAVAEAPTRAADPPRKPVSGQLATRPAAQKSSTLPTPSPQPSPVFGAQQEPPPLPTVISLPTQ